MKRRPMLNPYSQDTIEANILLNEGLMRYIDGDVENAKNMIQKSIEILNRWHQKRS